MNKHALLSLVVLSGVVAACGSSTTTEPAPAPAAITPPAATTPPTKPVPPTPPTPPLDHGAVSTTYPAFTPATGQILTGGGPVLKNPVIVTVTWPNDTQATDFETFGDTVGQGAYWKAITSEYGASAAVSGDANHVRLTDPAPMMFTDKQLASFIVMSLTTAPAPWPVPATGDPVYILYLPTTTTLILQGSDVCTIAVGGYHDSVMVNGKSVAYAIIPRCGNVPVDESTISASHELDEATTDPFPNSNAAYRGFRDEDLAWELFLQRQDEVGDACEFYDDSQIGPGDSLSGLATYAVQRQWSNASGLAGHDPCVPELTGEVYFNVTPIGAEDIQVEVDSSLITTKGFTVKAGTTRKIPLGFYSEAATPAWTIKAVDGTLTGGIAGDDITLALDVTAGQNGQKAYLSVTVNTATQTGSELITIVSKRNGFTHYMPLLIAN